MYFVLYLVLFIQVTLGREGFGPTDQEWGHVTVRTDASIFWWLHYTTADVPNTTDKPLIIWLQGGPGGSSTGYGNFREIGPLDVNLQNRSSTWVQWANILFVDNPAGVGFGYVDNDQYAKTNAEIASDFLTFLKSFYEKLPQFEGVQLYIFCESYGGKMTAEIALVLYKAQQNGEINSNLKGVGLGDSWISPIDSILTYAPYLQNLGIIDQDAYVEIQKIALEMSSLVDAGDFAATFNFWDVLTYTIEGVTNEVDFYNVLTKIKDFGNKKRIIGLQQHQLKDEDDEKLYNLMNNQVRSALSLTQTWQSLNNDVFYALSDDFMRPVTSIVEQLLNDTDITVAVYNGQLDLIVDTPGTIKWIQNLHFKDKVSWEGAPRTGFSSEGYYEGYVKKYGNFAFYWVDRAGHMVPSDNPSAMFYILKDVTNNFEV